MSYSKITIALLLVFLLLGKRSMAQGRPNWTSDQLMEPSELSTILKSNKNVPVIFSVGPGAVIPASRDIGMAKEAENLDKLKEQLSGLSKSTPIVIYCGCCPFERCPNVRPAIDMLKQMNFSNYKLLNLEHNIKIDWIEKGYPTKE
jgi:thiosulfate/3-mercaptopyruvate sulfurtransferase